MLATAAAIEGRSVRALDQTGLAQKGGAVVSDLTITRGEQPRSPKLGVGECDLYLGCDALVAADPANLQVTDARKTVAVISLSEVPTGSMVVTVTARYPGQQRIGRFSGRRPGTRVSSTPRPWPWSTWGMSSTPT